MPILLYNACMLGIDALALALVVRFRRPAVLVLAAEVVFVAALFLAALAGGWASIGLRMAAFGLFLPCPVVLTVGGWLLRRPFPKMAVASWALAVLLGLVALDAFVIEPSWLQVSRMRVVSPKLARPVRILLLADIQIQRLGEYERSSLRRALAERPDVILMSGDYLQAPPPRVHAALRTQFIAFLREIHFGAPLGVYAVRGDCEPMPDWAATFAGLPVTVLAETGTVDAGPLTISAFSVPDSLRPGQRVPDTKEFHIVLAHRPDVALNVAGGDLVLAGHSHGGQVCLPFYGPPMTLTQVPRQWVSGMTHLPDDRTLVVSRGVGVEHAGDVPRIRFLCRPEVVIIDLVPADPDSHAKTQRSRKDAKGEDHRPFG